VTITVPADAPHNKSAAGSIVAIVGSLVVHVPPGGLGKITSEVPTHKVIPPKNTGRAFTVTVVEVVQPPGAVYVITAVPGNKPVTMPVAAPTVAAAKGVVLHVPPEMESVSVIDKPWQTAPGPEIGGGAGLTVTVIVVVQLPSEYVITVVPALTPNTIPDDEPTVATAGVPLLHVPPAIDSLSEVVAPSQTVGVPVIAAGVVTTETTFVE